MAAYKKCSYDIVVVGGGHAGTEAALAAARLGCSTALISFSANSVGEMSCNPAIGGLGKGQLVREIDALFGEMGLAIDETGVQFRTLNSSKGPAVRSLRAQADRKLYQQRILSAVKSCANLDLIEAEVVAVKCSSAGVSGVTTADGVLISTRAVVLTTGTFLRGLMHTGPDKTEGGRIGEKAAVHLSSSLAAIGLKLARLKTGTPARILASSINFQCLREQPGDEPIRPFSFRTKSINRNQMSCWITSTNEETHRIIADNVSRSPLFNGQIQGKGPRYCPSIEDKVFRFPERKSHHIFLEPEGWNDPLVYPNGISTSLPADVQEAFIHSIKGLENAKICRYGYAVEYDFVPPQQLERTLRTKEIPGLFLAGQINGTSGYEEAGAQGIVAGINAACEVLNKEPIIISRELAYVGVMIDDLTTLGVVEPYRMFTSRAEHRLFLREDNADLRLTPLARKIGLVTDSDWSAFEKRQNRIEQEKQRLRSTALFPNSHNNLWLKQKGSALIDESTPLANLLRRPEITYNHLCEISPPAEPLEDSEALRTETEIKFAGYLLRQQQDILRLKKMEGVSIPSFFCYQEIQGLSVEVRERLEQIKPATLGQASRVSGVTPAALSILAVHLKKAKHNNRLSSLGAN